MAEQNPSSPNVTSNRGPQRRPRAPTITIDTSAASEPGNAIEEHDPNRLSDLPPRLSSEISPMLRPSTQSISDTADHSRSASFESRDSRPTSPHNVSSPTTLLSPNNNLLSVPVQRKRGGSVDTQSSISTTDSSTAVGTEHHPADIGSDGQKVGAGDHAVLPDGEALQADPGTEADFHRENNPFAFTPGQLGKLLNPKSLGAFHALGGIQGLERGLRSSLKSGLSPDEHHLDGVVTFEDATSQSLKDESLPPPEEGSKIEEATSADAFEDRKRIFGDNILPARRSKTIFELIWIAYNDKILILLTFAAVIALALGIYQSTQPPAPGEGPSVEWVEGVAIIVAIVVVTFVGAVNDWQKERQFVKLNKKKDDRNVKVIRSGTTQEISIHDILVGDILLVEPGDILPVDGIFISGHSVRCDESSATGESDVLKKSNADEVYRAMEAGQPLKKLDPFMISGAKVTEGFGRMLVTSTGIYSSHGKTMLSLREENEATPLQIKLNKMAEYIAKIGSAAALLLFVVLFIKFLAGLRNNPLSPAEKGREFIDIFIVAVIIVVVAVPEGLPLAVTLALAYATKRMLKDNNLVRVLKSCETMGNATCICSDKTGTLTQNIMTVVAGNVGTSNRFNNSKTDDSNSVGPAECVKALSADVRTLLKDSIAINSTAFEGEQDGKLVFIGSKTETALLNFARDHLAMEKVSIERSNAEVVQVVPFDSGRKCMAVVVKLQSGTFRLLVKGASEIMLEKCSNIIRDPTTQEVTTASLDNSHRATLNRLIEDYASRSLRTLGFVYRDFQEWPPRHARRMDDDKTQANFDDVFKSMTFLGIFGIQDPLRAGVPEAVADCLLAGVFPRMVTGDNITTAKAIAKECGIFTAGGVAIEGPAFRKMSKAEQLAIIPKLQVMARSSPDDKRILVKRLKEMGETVAVTGDGTNDAPALKSADIGFSMGIQGTEVAKEASDIILMDDNFTSIIKALMWGRAVNDAVQKFLQFQITVNITAVLLAFVSAVSNPEGQSVLKAVQLLWVNLIMDTMAALALATDPPSRAILNRKPDPKSAPLISVTMWKMIIGQAIYQLVVTFVLYFAGASIFQYNNAEELNSLQTMIFNTFVWMQIFNALNNRRLDNRFNVFEGMQRNPFFIGIWLIMIGGQILITFVGGAAFNVYPQQPDQWGVAVVLGAISLPIGVIIRLVPNELVIKLVPSPIRKWASTPKKDKIVITDEENPFQFNQALMDIKEELSFIKKYKGGRLRNLKFKMPNPKEMLHSRSPSRSRTSLSLPSTPQRVSTDVDRTAASPPPSSKRRGRDRSSSALAGAAMAGIIAGSIGGWSPVDRNHPEYGSLPWGTRSRNDVSRDVNESIEMHPETRLKESAVAVNSPDKKAPSQSTETTPAFGSGPSGGEPSKKLEDTEPSKEDSAP